MHRSHLVNYAYAQIREIGHPFAMREVCLEMIEGTDRLTVINGGEYSLAVVSSARLNKPGAIGRSGHRTRIGGGDLRFFSDPRNRRQLLCT
jgi:hypothetical protein